MNTLSKIISSKLLLNSLFAVFWLWLLAEKYEKALQGDTKAIALSLMYLLFLALNVFGIIKAIRESKDKNNTSNPSN